jgi:hypothetical protein
MALEVRCQSFCTCVQQCSNSKPNIVLYLSSAQRDIKIRDTDNNTGHISVNTTGLSVELLPKFLAFYKFSITLCAEERKIVVQSDG